MSAPGVDLDLLRNAALGIALAAACGLRIFLPLTVLSVASLLGWVHPAGDFSWIGSGGALTVLSVATVCEVVAYHVSWLDNLLDHVGAPFAIAAGTMMAASLLPTGDPLVRWTIAAIAGGGASGVVHLSLAALRQISSLTTGGFANPLLALGEAMGSLLVSLVALLAPVLAVAGVALVVGMLLRRTWRRRAETAPPLR